MKKRVVLKLKKKRKVRIRKPGPDPNPPKTVTAVDRKEVLQYVKEFPSALDDDLIRRVARALACTWTSWQRIDKMIRVAVMK